MSRDRLAGLRQQPSSQGYQQFNEYTERPRPSNPPSYRTQPSPDGSQHDPYEYSQPRRPQQAAQGLPRGNRSQRSSPVSPQSYQMQERPSRSPQKPPNPEQMKLASQPPVPIDQFFGEVDNIRALIKDLDASVAYINDLHSQSLSSVGDDQRAADIARETDRATEETRKLTSETRNRIKSLELSQSIRRNGREEQERQTMKQQTSALKEKFMNAVQSYQNIEARFRERNKQRIERQFQIVKPDATPEEVRAVVEGGEQTQIFAQALRSTTRAGEAQSVLSEVQSRHEDILQIEKTMITLAQLISDMAVMIEEQDEQFVEIEKQAEVVQKDMEAAVVQLEKGVSSAAGARKKRKICFVIILIILLVVAGVVAYMVLKNKKTNNNTTSNNTA